jgi:myo-inositol 2-dehydrogenase/D-chiro-inositol 1-dehydrogenase
LICALYHGRRAGFGVCPGQQSGGSGDWRSGRYRHRVHRTEIRLRRDGDHRQQPPFFLPGYDQRLELHGSEGLLCAGNILENQVQHYGKQGCTSALPEHFFLQRYKSAYAAEWEHFVAVLRGEAVPDCSGDDGERALYLADKALESLHSQREFSSDCHHNLPYTERHNNEKTDLSCPHRHDIRGSHC